MPDSSPSNTSGDRPLESDASALRHFEQLIQRGHEILYACGWDGKRYSAFRPGGVEVLKFRCRAIDLLQRHLSQSSEHRRTLKVLADDPAPASKGYHVKEILDVLEQSYSGLLRDGLFHTPDSVLAHLGDDSIEFAEALANAGRLVPACRCAGLVLDDVLRLLARARRIECADERAIDEINDALLDGRIYDETAHRRIGANLQIWHDLNSDEADRIPEEELREMLRWVRDFTVRHRLVTGDAQRTKRH